MTFGLLGRCPATGRIGAAAVSTGIAVGSRVVFCASGVGAVLTQHRADPRLGPRGLDLLRSGCDAGEALAALVASTPHSRWRQLAVLDAQGGSAAYTGSRVRLETSEAPGTDVVAIGNLLRTHSLAAAMVTAFQDARGPLAERLVRALEAGVAAGGEIRPSRSAALLVYGEQSFPLVDLRIDLAEAPVAALRTLWDAFAPMVGTYVGRAVDPDHAAPLV